MTALYLPIPNESPSAGSVTCRDRPRLHITIQSESPYGATLLYAARRRYSELSVLKEDTMT